MATHKIRSPRYPDLKCSYRVGNRGFFDLSTNMNKPL